MRKLTYIVMALALVLGFTQCKKEQIEPQNEGNGVKITLDVENGGSETDGAKLEVDPPHVNFETGDEILVVSNGHYVGTLTHDGSNFSGSITDPVEGQPLYFYFLGNKQESLTVGDEGCTVNISDQTGYPTLPVISFSASDQNFNGAGSYTASLHNKCSLMKFNVRTRSNSPIYITGMNNKVIIDFSKAASDGDNNGFTYDKEGNGIIMLKGGRGFPVEKWAIVLPQPELNAGHPGSTYAKNGSYTTFRGSRPKIHAIEANQYYHEGDDDIDLEVNTATDIVDLGDIIANKTIKTGETVIGTLATNYIISIADGATVTLDGVTINGINNESYKWAGISCLGNATIVLENGSENTVKGFYEDYPGIFVPNGSTLRIQGYTGSLTAISNGYAAGIGGGNDIDCGNIVIEGGNVTAYCDDTYAEGRAAGIGSGPYAACGYISISGGTVIATGGFAGAGIGCGHGEKDGETSCGAISISGGTVNATGGQYGAGIGSGHGEDVLEASSCGAISITGGIVNATGGQYAAGIGSGQGEDIQGASSCGDITIKGGTVTVTCGSFANATIGKSSNDSTCGDITIQETPTVTLNNPNNDGFPVGLRTFMDTGNTIYLAQTEWPSNSGIEYDYPGMFEDTYYNVEFGCPNNAQQFVYRPKN